jgi:hypothetical protein
MYVTMQGTIHRKHYMEHCQCMEFFWNGSVFSANKSCAHIFSAHISFTYKWSNGPRFFPSALPPVPWSSCRRSPARRLTIPLTPGPPDARPGVCDRTDHDPWRGASRPSSLADPRRSGDDTLLRRSQAAAAVLLQRCSCCFGSGCCCCCCNCWCCCGCGGVAATDLRRQRRRRRAS